jgi:hypothetical protein
MNGYLAASVTTKLAVHPWCDSLLGCLMSALETRVHLQLGKIQTVLSNLDFLSSPAHCARYDGQYVILADGNTLKTTRNLGVG